MIVVGVDPGGRWVGLVARRGDELLDHAVLECPRPDPGEAMVPAEFLVTVVGWVSIWTDERDAELVGIERASRPTGRRADGSLGPIEPGALIGLGMVAGAVLAFFPDAVVVPQAGSAPLYVYPKALVGAREKTGTGGRLRHARSAWDVAGSAPGIVRRLRALRS